MSVTNGQPGDENTFNNAFMSKTTDSTTVAKVDLNDSDAVSGTQVTNAQREHNSAASYIGKAINALKDVLPSWTSTAVGTPTDNLTERSEALTVQVGTNTGDIALKEDAANKGIANGYASLDAGAKVPLSELPDSVTNAREYKGTWAASTNTPTLADGDVENSGAEYAVIDDGTVDFGSGNIVFTNGDTVIYDGSIWAKIDGSIVRDLDDVRDVNAASPSDREYLRRNASNEWVNFNAEQIADDAATGANATLSAPADNSVIRLTGGALTSVDMIPATTTAQRFVLVNDTGGDVDINNLTGATAANQIITGTGLDLTLKDQSSLYMIYDTTDTKWRVVGGSGAGGANLFLSNLSSPVAVNQNLNPDGVNNRDLGSSANPWQTLYADSFRIRRTGQENGQITTLGTTPSGIASVLGFFANLTSKAVGIWTADGTATGDLYIETGDASAGDSGDISATIGTATGTQGDFKFLKTGQPSASGQVWTASSTDGTGYWDYSQGGAGGISIVDGFDSTFDQDVLTWSNYADAAQATPEDGDGGAPTVAGAFTAVVGEVLRDAGSYKITKDAANRQGEGVVLAQAVDIAFRGKSNRVSFNYLGSAAFDYGTVSTDSDVTVWAYDVTNSKLLSPNSTRLSGEGRFESDIFIPSTCEDIRFILHVATTNASAWDLIIDDFRCELVPFTTFNNMSDWIDAGPMTIGADTSAPTKGTTTTDRVLYRVVGDSAQIRYEYEQTTSGTAGSGTYFLEIPDEVGEIDTDKVNTALATDYNSYVSNVGSGEYAQPTLGYDMTVRAYDSKNLIALIDQQGGASAGNWGSAFGGLGVADFKFSVTVTVPILGRTSGAKHPAAIGLNAQAVFRGVSGTATVTASFSNVSFTAEEDTVGGWSTDTYTVKSPGYYDITAYLRVGANFSAGQRVDGEIYNLTTATRIGFGQETYPNSPTGGINMTAMPKAAGIWLNYGEQIVCRVQSQGASPTVSSECRMSIIKIGSEQQPYAPRVAYIKDVKANTIDGGTFTSGAWQTRDLNTLEGVQDFISLSANQFTLEPGTYQIEAQAPGHFIDRHKSKLRNITDSNDTLIGSSAYTNANLTAGDQTVTEVKGAFTIGSSKTFEIQHRCETTQTTNGFGVSNNFGVDEVYTQVKITKIL